MLFRFFARLFRTDRNEECSDLAEQVRARKDKQTKLHLANKDKANLVVKRVLEMKVAELTKSGDLDKVAEYEKLLARHLERE